MGAAIGGCSYWRVPSLEDAAGQSRECTWHEVPGEDAELGGVQQHSSALGALGSQSAEPCAGWLLLATAAAPNEAAAPCNEPLPVSTPPHRLSLPVFTLVFRRRRRSFLALNVNADFT